MGGQFLYRTKVEKGSERLEDARVEKEAHRV
jgi:hypothetical protein